LVYAQHVSEKTLLSAARCIKVWRAYRCTVRLRGPPVNPTPPVSISYLRGVLAGGSCRGTLGHGRHLLAGVHLRLHNRPPHSPLKRIPDPGGVTRRGERGFLALMAGVTWQLGQASVFEPIPALIALVSLVLLFRTEINPVWLVIGGGRYRTPLLDILSLMCRLPYQSRGSQKGRCSGPKGSNNSPRSTGQGYSRPTGPLGPTTSLLSPKRLMTRASPPSCSN
jgi:hypothetical protein